MPSHTTGPCPPGCFDCAASSLDNSHTMSLSTLVTRAVTSMTNTCKPSVDLLGTKLRISWREKVEPKFLRFVEGEAKQAAQKEGEAEIQEYIPVDLLAQEEEASRVQAIRRKYAEAELHFERMLAFEEAGGELDVVASWVQPRELDIAGKKVLRCLIVEEQLAWEQEEDSEAR